MSVALSQGKDRQPNLKTRLYKDTISYCTNKYNDNLNPEGNWGIVQSQVNHYCLLKWQVASERRKKNQKAIFTDINNNNVIM